MQAVSLDRFAGDLAVILAIDWLLDRCRTAVNLLGDSYGVLVVDHLVRYARAYLPLLEFAAVHISGSSLT